MHEEPIYHGTAHPHVKQAHTCRGYFQIQFAKNRAESRAPGGRAEFCRGAIAASESATGNRHIEKRVCCCVRAHARTSVCANGVDMEIHCRHIELCAANAPGSPPRHEKDERPVVWPDPALLATASHHLAHVALSLRPFGIELGTDHRNCALS